MFKCKNNKLYITEDDFILCELDKYYRVNNGKKTTIEKNTEHHWLFRNTKFKPEKVFIITILFEKPIKLLTNPKVKMFGFGDCLEFDKIESVQIQIYNDDYIVFVNNISDYWIEVGKNNIQNWLKKYCVSFSPFYRLL